MQFLQVLTVVMSLGLWLSCSAQRQTRCTKAADCGENWCCVYGSDSSRQMVKLRDQSFLGKLFRTELLQEDGICAKMGGAGAECYTNPDKSSDGRFAKLCPCQDNYTCGPTGNKVNDDGPDGMCITVF